mgnify:FL=1
MNNEIKNEPLFENKNENDNTVVNDEPSVVLDTSVNEAAVNAEVENNQNFGSADISQQPVQAIPLPDMQPNVVMPKKRSFVLPGRADITFAIITFAVSLISAYMGITGGFKLGFAISNALCVGTVYMYTVIKKRRISLFGTLCAIMAVLLGIPFALNNEAGLHFLSFAAIMLLIAFMLINEFGVNRFDMGRYTALLDAAVMWFGAPFKYVGGVFYSLFGIKNKEGKSNSSVIVIAGIACAVPCAIIMICLLMKGDIAFEWMMQKTVFGDLSRLGGSFVLGILMFSIVFTVLFALGSKMYAPLPREGQRELKGAISHTAVNSFFGVLSVVYILFILSQLAYFFSAFSGVLPKEFTYADYARRGFFDMCRVSALNLLFIALALMLTKKNEKGALPPSTRIFTLCAALFSVMLTAISAAKMIMYIQNYGLTVLRVSTSVFMLWLFIVTLLISIRILNARFSYMKILSIVTAVILFCVSFVGINTTVSKYNYYRYSSGISDKIDVYTIYGLTGGAGVPELIKLAKSEDSTVAEEAKINLAAIFTDYYEWHGDAESSTRYSEPDFTEYCFETERNAALLKKNYDLFSRYIGYENLAYYDQMHR